MKNPFETAAVGVRYSSAYVAEAKTPRLHVWRYQVGSLHVVQVPGSIGNVPQVSMSLTVIAHVNRATPHEDLLELNVVVELPQDGVAR